MGEMEQGRVRERGSGSGPDAEASLARVFGFPPFRLEPASERLWREQEPVALKPKAFAILLYLVEHPHRIVTKGELLERIWSGVHVNDAVLKTHLREIRRALGDDVRAPRYIETAHRRGYRFIASTLNVLTAAGRAGATANPVIASDLSSSVASPSVASPSARPAGSVPAVPEPALKAAFPPDPHFIGRQAELEWLRAAHHQASLGQRQVVLINGPAGIGKTSLVRAFARGVPQGGGSLAWGQCVEPCGADEALFLPLIEALARLGRGPDRARWVEHLSRCAPSWVARLPIFQPDAPAAQGPSALAAPEHMLHQLAEALETFTQHEPLLLVLDDIQWADASTLAWLAYMARRNDPARLLVVCTFRPLEVSRGAHPLAALKRALERQSSRAELKVPCLQVAEVGAYVAARFPDAAMRAELVSLLHARTAGNPLFMVRVFDSWIERGLLSPRAGHWQLTGSRTQLEQETPDSVVSLIEQEYEQLTEFECNVIAAASVVGQEFSAASVAAALSVDLLSVEDLCVRWAKHGQFFQILGKESWPDGTLATRLGFVHSLYRETAYARLGAARQALLHLSIARWQEHAYGERSVEIASELALHFERARECLRAALYLCSAGERALTTSAYAEAGVHFEKALALIEHVPHGVQRARVEIRLQVGVAALLAATRGRAVEKERAAHTAVAIGKQFLTAANARRDEGAELRANLLLGMAEACLGDLQSARSRLEYTISRNDVGWLRHTPDGDVAGSSPRPLPGPPEPALPLASAVGSAMVLSAEVVNPHGAVLALTWRAMLCSFLGEAAANDGQVEQPAAPDDAPALLQSNIWHKYTQAATVEYEGAEPSRAVQWVEGLLRQALAEVDRSFADTAFGDTAAQNDLEAFELRHGYRFERLAAEGSRRVSPVVPRD
jgi:DNA-binding winged helix-turn-helix (wHTH) protein